MRILGKHILIDLWDCRDGLNDVEAVKKALVEAATATRATIIEVRAHHFSPHGVTGIAILAESHLAIHTWPEYNYVAADLFSCGQSTEPEHAAEVLRRHFQAEEVRTRSMDRGIAISAPDLSQ